MKTRGENHTDEKANCTTRFQQVERKKKMKALEEWCHLLLLLVVPLWVFLFLFKLFHSLLRCFGPAIKVCGQRYWDLSVRPVIVGCCFVLFFQILLKQIAKQGLHLLPWCPWNKTLKPIWTKRIGTEVPGPFNGTNTWAAFLGSKRRSFELNLDPCSCSRGTQSFSRHWRILLSYTR